MPAVAVLNYYYSVISQFRTCYFPEYNLVNGPSLEGVAWVGLEVSSLKKFNLCYRQIWIIPTGRPSIFKKYTHA